MSHEEMDKRMEFIVEQQAKFAADIEIMREVQAADAKRLGDGLLGVIDIVGHLARYQMRTEDTVNSLTQDVSQLTQGFNRLTLAQAQTEASLKILINVVERKFGGNGESTNPV
jgi:hypothetical protein